MLNVSFLEAIKSGAWHREMARVHSDKTRGVVQCTYTFATTTTNVSSESTVEITSKVGFVVVK